MKKFIEKLIGSYSDREIKRLMPIVEDIEDLEPKIEVLTDEQLKMKTEEFKKRLSEGETLDDILPEAFAVVRETSKRVLGMRHFKVQLLGGVVLHQGRIAEMKTGEGKTLVATLPAYLNALTGKGVHIVTVNDYLAKRDSEWMGKVYRFLGLSVGLIVHDLNNKDRRKAYASDIVYGTNNEFGFDYLRDNMVIYKEDMVQRELNYAIIDEVDSILIDEARTPLIISGAGDKSTDLYKQADAFVRRLRPFRITETDDKVHDDDIEADYIIDEKAKSATLTKRGVLKAEQAFGVDNLSDPENMTLSHHINQAIKAHGTMRRDIDYVVKDGEVIIVDEFTGRMMFGRRYSEGLHQAIEAKEGVKIERESKTLATITFQNYFRMYSKLAGMTGTAVTEEEEFRTIYNLDVIEVPTNMPMIRKDHPDIIYRNERAKFKAVVNDIVESHKKGQPVLVGTISIEKSEVLSKLLKKEGIKHEVLNAKFHAKEAEIVAQAGKKGAVTIATNMAGRGTDIVLGGNPEYMAVNDMVKQNFEEELIVEARGFAETKDKDIINARKVFSELMDKYRKLTAVEKEEVLAAGGLKIIGTERHESRRIDNQLRGRAGRQGDPGESRFYISLEDDLMRLFGSERVTAVVDALGMDEDQPLEHKMLSNAIENAQKKVEGKNFNIRKHVLQYDDVMNQQREVIYSQRQKVLNGENLKPSIKNMIENIVDNLVNQYTSESEYPDDWNLTSLIKSGENIFIPEGSFTITREEMEDLTKESLKDKLRYIALNRYEQREQEVGSEVMREFERVVMLKVVDQKWMDHIDAMDQLRRGIGLRAYGQRDPVVEYKFEGFNMFEEMINSIQQDTVRILFNATFESLPQREKVAKPTKAVHEEGNVNKTIRKGKKIGRNEPCPCGSGKKYKKCCGRN